MTNTQTSDTARPPAHEGRPASWGDIAVTLARALANADFPRGDLAQLRRMGPGRAGCRGRLATAGKA